MIKTTDTAQDVLQQIGMICDRYPPGRRLDVLEKIYAVLEAARDIHQAKQQATAKVYQFPKRTTAK